MKVYPTARKPASLLDTKFPDRLLASASGAAGQFAFPVMQLLGRMDGS